MRIETVKGNYTAPTLEDIWAWQDEMQGAFASLVLDDGTTVDVSECDTLDDVRAAIGRELLGQLARLDDGTGNLGIVIRDALRRDGTTTADDVVAIWREAEEEHRANVARA